MARTKQTARSAAPMGPRNETSFVEDPNLNDEKATMIKEIEAGDMQPLLKHIDKKYTEKGQIYYCETVDEEIPEQVNWWGKFALCLVRHMDRNNKYVASTSLQVNSQHLKDILRTTIGNYPGVSFLTKEVTVNAPYHPLFHYRRELADARKELVDEEAIAHLDLLIAFINEQFKDTIAETTNYLEQGIMSYGHLWTIFRPGSIVYAPVLGQARAFTLTSYAYACQPPGLNLNIDYVDYDGHKFGTRSMQRLIPAFSGAQKIRHFSAYPLSMHVNAAALKEQLIERGRRFESYAGMHFSCYKGVAMSNLDRYSIDGRIVIDTKTFHRLNANHAFWVNDFPKSDNDDDDDNEDLAIHPRKRLRYAHDIDEDEDPDADPGSDLTADSTTTTQQSHLKPLTNEQCFLATAMVRGFSFSEKRWCDFFLDQCFPVDWNPHCFDQLVLPTAQKSLVQALVANHITQSTNASAPAAFDDIVKGKGKGLILVLHGPPGVGKTLTAETVAEYSRRPLYSVSSGDLGTSATTLDERLSRILDMASTWRAVLLIDEADVFLEKRSLHDLNRNGLVSIFLRVLEYYEGILFLTSNRVRTFDDAFKSRIHVPLKYADLTEDSRRAIWRNFLERKDGGTGVDVDEDGYRRLAQTPINGRQIKNVIRTAKSLAQFHGEKLDLTKLEQVIQIQMDFENELNGVTVDDGDHQAVNNFAMLADDQ